MGSLAQHHASVTVDGDVAITLPVLDGTIALDAEWMPYVQATLTCPYDARVVALDPQENDIWIEVTVTRSMGRTDRIRDLSIRYAGRMLAAISAEFAGQSIAAITASLYHDYENPGAPRDDERRTFRVMLREVQVDHAAATVSLRLASGESRLADWHHMSPTTVRQSGADLAVKINTVLALVGFTDGLDSRPAVVPTDAQIGDEALHAPGQTALEWLQQITRKHDLMCWCDENGLWHLAADRNSTTIRALTSLGTDRTVVNATETTSRDEGWVTAVMLIYTWAGVTSYDIATTPGSERAHIVRYSAPFPGSGRAARMLAQLRDRGRSLTVEAVSEPLFTPGETVTVTTATGTRAGKCASVRWRLASDQMTLTLREVA